MFRRHFLRFALSITIVALFAGFLSAEAQDSSRRGRKYKPPPATAKIEISVLRNEDGKPIENAAVIFRSLDEKGNMELKSNEDGKAVIDVLPIGATVRLQIIAKGYQTYGQDYKVDKDQMAIAVRMKRPGKQYSIYPSRPENNQNQDPNQDKKQDKPKEETKPQQ
jgi:hypothetical protein